MTDEETKRAIDSLDGINASLRSIAESFAAISQSMQTAIDIDQQRQRGKR